MVATTFQKRIRLAREIVIWITICVLAGAILYMGYDMWIAWPRTLRMIEAEEQEIIDRLNNPRRPQDSM